MDQIPKSRRIYDLIRKLTCNRLDDGQEVVKITKSDATDSVEKYLKKKDASVTINDFSDVAALARAERVSEERCSQLISGLVGWPGFRDVFTISALTGDGVDDLRKYLMDAAQPGKWRFDSSLKTDDDPKEVLLGTVRSQFLSCLPGAIAYSLVPTVSMWSFDEEWQKLRIIVDVVTSNPSTHRTVIGTKGSKLAQICRAVEADLLDFFSHEVHFSINVKPSFTIKPTPPTHDTRNVDLFL
jgi:GTPase Era involved in 16S rRNA processing